MEVAHLDDGQAGLDGTGCVACRQRESPEAVAAGDQPGPARVVKRRRPRMPRHEALPAGIGQLQDRDAAHALVVPAARMPGRICRRHSNFSAMTIGRHLSSDQVAGHATTLYLGHGSAHPSSDVAALIEMMVAYDPSI